MNKLQFIFCTCLLGTCSVSCSQPNKQVETTAVAARKEFRLPHVPETLRTPEERATYLALHYWDHYDFRDTALVRDENITEQAFVNFLSILPYTTADKAQEAMDTLFHRAATDKETLLLFMNMGDMYLYEPNSPMHNEEQHILQLQAVLRLSALDNTEKQRARSLLEMALRNRPGNVAEDFVFVLRNGKQQRLHQVKAKRLLVYFNDPECDDCIRTKEVLDGSALLNEELKRGELKVLSVCVEGKTAAWEATVLPQGWMDAYDDSLRLTRSGLYDLKAMPSLYLLDSDKRVLLKDASAEEIEAWYKTQSEKQ